MVASDTGTLARVASSLSISAVRWRSPLPNSSQPSAMRWRVGRKLTWRSIAFTSCHGQPVSSERSAAFAAAAGVTYGNTMVRGWLIVTPKQPAPAGRQITVSFATYTPVSYTHLRAHETRHDLVCRLL